MENQVRQFLPIKEVTARQVVVRYVKFVLVLLLFALLNYFRMEARSRTYGDTVPLMVTAAIFLPMIAFVIANARVTTQITIDLVTKTFTADYFNALGQSKTITLDLYNCFISYDFTSSKSGGYWQLKVYEDIIKKWHKVTEGKSTFSKEQLDEMYALLQPYQKNAPPINHSRIYIYSAVFTALILTGAILDIFYAFRHPQTLVYVGAICLVIGIIGLVFSLFYIRPAKKSNYGLSWLLAIALVFLSAFVIGQLKKVYVKDQLKKYGVTTNGFVLYTYQTAYKRSHRRFATISFGTNNHSYFKNIDNARGFYRAGDTLKVLFSSANPEIYIIVGDKAAAHRRAVNGATSVRHTAFINKK